MTIKSKEINPLDISFKEFMPGQIIQSGQFNDDMNDIEEKVNEIIDDHNVVSKDLYTHLEVFDNPHRVDAHQTGTYFTEEIDEFIQDVKSGNLYDNSITNRVLDDDSVDNRNIIDGSITNSKLDSSIGSQIDISQNISITDRYTKDETDELIRSKVGEGTYSREELDVKFEQIQAGQIVDNTIGVEKLKNNVGTMLDISNNASITNKYTKAEVNALILKNGLPKDWGDLSPIVEDDGNIPDIPENGAFNLSSLPICDIMVAGDFKATVDDILDLKIKEVVESRGGMPSLNDRITSISEKVDNVNDTISKINPDINYFKTNVDDILSVYSNQNLSENGYKYLPGGLLIQWGRVDVRFNSESRLAFAKNYNIPFRTPFIVVCSVDSVDSGYAYSDFTAISAITDNSSFHMETRSLNGANYQCNVKISWFAIGM